MFHDSKKKKKKIKKKDGSYNIILRSKFPSIYRLTSVINQKIATQATSIHKIYKEVSKQAIG